MSTLYFKELFASTVALQVHLFLPLVIEKSCNGCQLGSSEDFDHDVCHLPAQDLVNTCFQGSFTMIDKDHAEEQFRNFVYPRPAFLFEDTWFEDLWTNEDWLQLVEYRVFQLRQRVMNV